MKFNIYKYYSFRIRLASLKRECSLLSSEIYLQNPDVIHPAYQGKPSSYTSTTVMTLFGIAVVGMAYLVSKYRFVTIVP